MILDYVSGPPKCTFSSKRKGKSRGIYTRGKGNVSMEAGRDESDADTSWGVQVATRSWKKQGTTSPVKDRPANSLGLVP